MIKHSFIAIVAAIMLIGCKKEPNVSVIEKKSLTVSPVEFNEFVGLVPLGSMNPPNHTFPTKHMYFYYKDVGVSRNIKSPGNLHIYSLSRDRHHVGKPEEVQDYSIRFGTRGKTEMYFLHVSTLSQKLLDAAKNFSGIICESYEKNGIKYERCRLDVSIEVTTGEILGTGNTVPGQFALDMGVLVNDVAVCPLDYFEPNIRAQLENRLSNYNGTEKRTAQPLCGEVNQNILGTAQGNWYKKDKPDREDNGIALVKDAINPSMPVFSIGNGLIGQTPGFYTFSKLGFGYINRLFKDIKADGKVYCYNLKQQIEGVPIPNQSVIIRLENNNELSVEKRNCDCSCQPFQFTNNKVTYTKAK